MDLISVDMIIVATAFYSILAVTLFSKSERKNLASKTKQEWLIDITGLLVQGVVVPLAKSFVLIQGLIYLLPDFASSLEVNGFAAFLIAFVAVDYLYYWNHRLLHSDFFWPFHALHHTPKNMEFTVTSRNMVLTPFLIVYVWIHTLFYFLLADPTYYLIGVAVTAALDLLRHTSILPPKLKLFCLITPNDHAWHHSLDNKNYGANLNVWDKIHGTWKQSDQSPKSIGSSLSLKLKHLFVYSAQPEPMEVAAVHSKRSPHERNRKENTLITG